MAKLKGYVNVAEATHAIKGFDSIYKLIQTTDNEALKILAEDYKVFIEDTFAYMVRCTRNRPTKNNRQN